MKGKISKSLAISIALVFIGSGFVIVAEVPEIEWERTFGGLSGDYSHSVQQTSDEGYIIAGWVYFYGDGSYDVWLIKVEPEWSF